MTAEYQKALEASTGKTIEELRETPLSTLFDEARAKFGSLHLTTTSPHIVTHEEAEEALNQALKRSIT